MNVRQLIDALSVFPNDMEVVLFDGYKCVAYKGDWEIREFEGTVDIGIGGTEVDDSEDEG